MPGGRIKRTRGQYVGQETDLAAESRHAQEPLIALKLGAEAAIPDDFNHAEEYGKSISFIGSRRDHQKLRID